MPVPGLNASVVPEHLLFVQTGAGGGLVFVEDLTFVLQAMDLELCWLQFEAVDHVSGTCFNSVYLCNHLLKP